MKYYMGVKVRVRNESLPARGAWIEIHHTWHFVMALRVAPRSGGVD